MPNKPTYEVGEEITYKCRDGFELKGDRVIECQDDGNFDPRPPICQRKIFVIIYQSFRFWKEMTPLIIWLQIGRKIGRFQKKFSL